MTSPLCLTCGDELDVTADGLVSPDGLTTCSATGRPHTVQLPQQVSPSDLAPADAVPSQDLYGLLLELTAGRGWNTRFDVGASGWRLVDNGVQRRYPCNPVDEHDVLVYACLLYILNDAGPMPIPSRVLDVARRHGMTAEKLQIELRKAAMSLYYRIRVRSRL